MPFNASVNLGTIGNGITGQTVSISGCTGTCINNVTAPSGCSSLVTGQAVSSFLPNKTISGITDNVVTLWVKVDDGSCSGTTQCISISNIPTPTPTPTAPANTPTPTPTPSAPTPTPTPSAPTPTPTPSAPTPTPTPSAPTPTPTPTEVVYSCGDTVSDTYTPSNFTVQTKYLNLTSATNGATITISFAANDRPNRFNIYDNSSNLIVTSGWVGSDNTYAGPWGSPGSLVGSGSGTMQFTYNNTKTYELRVDVGPANPNATPTPNPSDAWSATITCGGVSPTPTPTPLPTYEGIIVKLQGASGANGNLTVYQSSDNITFTSSLTITTTDNQLTQQTFNGTPGYYYYFIVARTSGTSNRLNWYTQVSPSDFNPGPINGAGCTNSPGTSTLQSDTFQLPNPVQSTSQIIFYGDISDACL